MINLFPIKARKQHWQLFFYHRVHVLLNQKVLWIFTGGNWGGGGAAPDNTSVVSLIKRSVLHTLNTLGWSTNFSVQHLKTK